MDNYINDELIRRLGVTNANYAKLSKQMINVVKKINKSGCKPTCKTSKTKKKKLKNKSKKKKKFKSGQVHTARVDEQSDSDSSDNDTSSSESEDSSSSSESSSSESESEAEADAEINVNISRVKKKVKKEQVPKGPHSTITSSQKKKSKTCKSHKVKDIETPPLASIPISKKEK